MLGNAKKVAWAALGALALAASTGCSSTTADTSPSSANPLDSEEQALIGEINNFRASANAGLVPLAACGSLDVAAAAHADDMRNQDYLSDKTPDGVDTATRDCDGGYTPACNHGALVSELVAAGNDMGVPTAQQWENDPDTSISAIMLDPMYKVIGVGRAFGNAKTYWAADVSIDNDPSCVGAQ